MTISLPHQTPSTDRRDRALEMVGVTAWTCRKGREPLPTRVLDSKRDVEDVLWLDVHPNSDPIRAYDALRVIDPALRPEHLIDLLDRDDLAQFSQVEESIRNVSVVGLVARPSDADTPGEVVFQMVETLVGDGWVITCWQPALRCSGTDPQSDLAPVLKEEVVAEVSRAWVDGGCAKSGDCATAIVESLAERYRPAHRLLEHWLQVWELAFHSGRVDDTRALKQLLAMVNESRRRLAAFNNMRCQTPDKHWFPYLSSPDADKRADDRLDLSLARLALLFDSIRADMELVCMEKMVKQAETAELSSKAEREFELQLGRITALLLVPTLIAGVFGANTRLPGGGTWMGFDAMVALMIVTSAVVYFFIVRRFRRSERAAQGLA